MNIGLQQVPCGIITFTDEGIIQQANAAFCTLLQYEEAEVTGKNINLFFTLATRIFYQTHFSNLLKLQGFADEIYLTLLSKDKTEVPVLVNGNRSVFSGKALTTCACIALYQRNKFEAELIQAKKVAEKALSENAALIAIQTNLQAQTEKLDKKIGELQQRNTDLEQLSNIITHDLQEPLRKLQVFADMLKTQYLSQNKQTDRMLEKVISISEYMRELLVGLQKYLWLDDETSALKEIELSKLLLVVQQQLTAEYSSIPYKLDTENLISIQGYWDQLVVLFYELLSNSIKFRKAGQLLHIQIRGLVIQQNKFKSIEGKYEYINFLRIKYEDNGIGFEEKFSTHAFDLLKKADRNSKGLGIGLTMCKKIVTNHQGSITASGKENAGAAFTILLPVRQF